MQVTPYWMLVLCALGLLMSPLQAQGQSVRVEIGPDQIPINQPLQITVTVENDRLRQVEGFPQIEDFIKQGTFTNSQTSIVNGQVSQVNSLTMRYYARRQGNLVIPPFTMTINGQTIEVVGKTIEVGPELQDTRDKTDPFGGNIWDNLFGPRPTDEVEYIDVEDDAFFALTTDKNEVYIGEGVNLSLAFYIAETNQAQLQFPDIQNQVNNLSRAMEVPNAWEESFLIDRIEPEKVTIRGKVYTRYRLYQSTVYPLTLDPIKFEPLSLDMIKYKEANRRTFGIPSRQATYKTYYTRAKTIPVRDLPPHPLKNRVSVGKYRLYERLSATELNTGQSLRYNFRIAGEGNLSTISAPSLPEDLDAFEVYEPDKDINITRADNAVKGAVTFNYYAIPQEPGQYDLGEIFQWVYFDPDREVYDTLRSLETLRVGGESLKNEAISGNDLGGFYDRLAVQDNTLKARGDTGWFRIFANFMILALLAISAFLILKKK